MIISRAPLRVSFLGGGSDLPSFYEQEEGAVIGCSIRLSVHLTLYETVLRDRYVIKYSETEVVDQVAEIRHRIIHNVFSSYQIGPVNLTSESHVQAGTGLGSSSSFTVALINLCNHFTGREMSPEEVAAKACDIEINQLGAPIGKQDQYMAACGGLNFITFNKGDQVSVNAVECSGAQRQQLEDHLVMYYVGNTRSANDILADQQSELTRNASVRENSRRMADLARQFHQKFDTDITLLGDYLHEAWMIKKNLTGKISSPLIDEMYEKALAAGAIGGKLLGAGGGGYLLFWCPPERQQDLSHALAGVPSYRFEIDTVGPEIFDLR